MATRQTGKSDAKRKTRAVATSAAESAKPSAAKVTRAKRPRSAFTDKKWHEMVAIAAYYRAQARMQGSPQKDWLDAEAELKKRFGNI